MDTLSLVSSYKSPNYYWFINGNIYSHLPPLSTSNNTYILTGFTISMILLLGFIIWLLFGFLKRSKSNKRKNIPLYFDVPVFSDKIERESTDWFYLSRNSTTIFENENHTTLQ